jgi:hypothetical protein
MNKGDDGRARKRAADLGALAHKARTPPARLLLFWCSSCHGGHASTDRTRTRSLESTAAVLLSYEYARAARGGAYGARAASQKKSAASYAVAVHAEAAKIGEKAIEARQPDPRSAALARAASRAY